MTQRLEELTARREEARHAGSARAVERQHAQGKMTARERIEYLLDEGSFQELDMLARHRAHGWGLDDNRPYTDGVITGFGTIDGRRVGDTPIGNLGVAIGPHEIVFKHPQLGEKHQAISVTLTEPVRVSVDMR